MGEKINCYISRVSCKHIRAISCNAVFALLLNATDDTASGVYAAAVVSSSQRNDCPQIFESRMALLPGKLLPCIHQPTTHFIIPEQAISRTIGTKRVEELLTNPIAGQIIFKARHLPHKNRWKRRWRWKNNTSSTSPTVI
jgi:hypothetical protein